MNKRLYSPKLDLYYTLHTDGSAHFDDGVEYTKFEIAQMHGQSATTVRWIHRIKQDLSGIVEGRWQNDNSGKN